MMSESRSKPQRLKLVKGTDQQPETAPYDVAASLDKINKLEPNLKIADRDLERYRSFLLIKNFVSNFTFYESGEVRISVRPPQEILDELAKRFRLYLKGRSSLDQAFGLAGKGRSSPREKFTIASKTVAMRLQYKELRGAGTLLDDAVERIAKSFNVSDSTVRSRLFRK